MQDDLTRMVTVVLETLPLRLKDGAVTESMVAEALDVFTIDELMRRPETRVRLDQIREKLCYALVGKLREQHGPQYETLSTGLYACSRCRATPIICMVIQESPCVVVLQCRGCSYEERKTLLDGELVEIRSEGSPVDWRGEPIIKKGKHRNKRNSNDQDHTDDGPVGAADKVGIGGAEIF
jgi:hypothetical protein